MQEIMKTIKAAREQLGLTQREAANRVGMGASQWSEAESGVTVPLVTTLLKMCEAVHIKIGMEREERIPVAVSFALLPHDGSASRCTRDEVVTSALEMIAGLEVIDPDGGSWMIRRIKEEK